MNLSMICAYRLATPIENNSTIAEKILALPDKICYNIYVKIRKDIFTK